MNLSTSAQTFLASPAPNGNDDTTASVLCNRARAKWVRPLRLGIQITAVEQLAQAQGAGVPPGHLVINADRLSPIELITAVGYAAGHIVVHSERHIELLDSLTAHRVQHILLYTDGTPRRRFDRATVAKLVEHPQLRVIGLHGDIGSRSDDFISVPAAIGHMIAEMDLLRDHQDLLLTRLSVGVEHAAAFRSDDLVAELDETVRQACSTYGYPVPGVIVSTPLSAIRCSAA